MLTSDSKLACPDHCIYDAGHNCETCERYENTVRAWLERKADEFIEEWKNGLLPWDDPALMSWPSKESIKRFLLEAIKYGRSNNGT